MLGLAAPAAYTLSTVRQAHDGALPTAGPAGAVARRASAAVPRRFPRRATGPGGDTDSRRRPRSRTAVSRAAARIPPAGGDARRYPGGVRTGGGGIGGLLNGSTPSAAITTLFEQSTGYRWTAAAIGANNAAGYQLASGQAIMAIGGFNGTDPTPTLAQFQQYVRSGKIHYFIGAVGGGGFGPGGGAATSTSSAITQWVEDNFTAQTVGGVTIYDLSPVQPRGPEPRRATGTLLPWPTRLPSRIRRCRTCRPSTRPRCG